MIIAIKIPFKCYYTRKFNYEKNIKIIWKLSNGNNIFILYLSFIVSSNVFKTPQILTVDLELHLIHMNSYAWFNKFLHKGW